MLIQFVLSLILVLALVVTWRRVRQQAIRGSEAWAWSVVWIIAGAVVWKPNATTMVANFFGIGRGSDFILYGAVITLLLLVFHLHIAHDRLERQLTELVRREALNDLEPKA